MSQSGVEVCRNMSHGIVRNLLFTVLFFLTTTLSSFAQDEYWYKSQFNTGVYGNCGPTSVAMLVYYVTDVDVTVQAVRKVIGFNNSQPLLQMLGGAQVPKLDDKGHSVPNGSTSIDDLERGLTHYGVNFIDYDTGRAFADEIDPLVNMGYKIIVLVNLDDIPAKANRGQGYGGHYFILSGVDGDNYIIQDPFNGSNVRFNRKMVTRAMKTTRMILVLKPTPFTDNNNQPPPKPPDKLAISAK